MMFIRLQKDRAALDPHWNYVYSTTREFMDEWAGTFAAAHEALRAKLSVTDLAAAIEVGDAERIMANVDDVEEFGTELRGLQAPLNAVYGRAGTAELGRLRLGLRFDLQNPYALRWLETSAARLVTEVTEQTKAGLRSMILQGFKSGIPPRRFAIQIRQMVGLTERDARAVGHYWERLAADGERPARRVDEMAETYARRLLRRRALNIARTETVAAAGNGTQHSWYQARDAGLVAAESKREWIASAASPRTCELCLSLDGQKVGLDEPFSSALAGSIMTPPLHPQCRCAMALRTEVPA